jgi:hypothetical protein
MTDAAKRGRIYHLWWHPHNFGVHLDENLAFLRLVLDHYRLLRERYEFQSVTMSDCYRLAESAETARGDQPASVAAV